MWGRRKELGFARTKDGAGANLRALSLHIKAAWIANHFRFYAINSLKTAMKTKRKIIFLAAFFLMTAKIFQLKACMKGGGRSPNPAQIKKRKEISWSK
jgi:hypothetical protein